MVVGCFGAFRGTEGKGRSDTSQEKAAKSTEKTGRFICKIPRKGWLDFPHMNCKVIICNYRKESVPILETRKLQRTEPRKNRL